MNTNWNIYDSRKKAAADDRDRKLERAIVVGAVLILVLVAVVYYIRFADPGQPADGYSTSTLQPITRH